MLNPFRCGAVALLALCLAGSPAMLANSVHRHRSPAEAGATMDQLMLVGYNTPSTQLDESRNRRNSGENSSATVQDTTAISSPATLDLPIPTGTLDVAPSDVSPRRHRHSSNAASPVSDPSPSTVSTVLETIPSEQSGRHHHRGDVITLQSGVVLNTSLGGAVSEGLNLRDGTPLGDPLPVPSAVPEPGSLGLALLAFAVAGIAYRKSTAKAQAS